MIANGDIVDAASAREALDRSGADGVMVGRGAQGAPWIPAQIAHEIYGTPAPDIPAGADLVAMVRAHYSDMLAFYGTDLGLRCARKHLGWYMDRAGTPKPLRQQILRADDPDIVIELLNAALTGAGEQVAA